jgi:hypothetical protein
MSSKLQTSIEHEVQIQRPQNLSISLQTTCTSSSSSRNHSRKKTCPSQPRNVRQLEAPSTNPRPVVIPRQRAPFSEDASPARPSLSHFNPGTGRSVMWARSLTSRTSLHSFRTIFPKPLPSSRLAVPTALRSASHPHFRYIIVRMASTLPRLPIFEALKKHDGKSTAVVHSISGRSFTYGELINDVAAAKYKLQQNANGQRTEGARIAFLVENGYDYVGAHWYPPSAPRETRLCAVVD